jgi:ABC-2 type transport system ATP-binding protein
VDRVCKAYRRTVALADVSFEASAGVMGLLGPNGAGKTTLFRVLTGVLRADRGTVEVQLGCGSADRLTADSIGYLPQSLGYFPDFTVREFVRYVAWLRHVGRRESHARVTTALQLVGLETRADAKLRALSGGMLRRVGIASAVVNDPLVLLMDEPTAGLDIAQREQFRDLVGRLGQDRIVLLSTHQADDVARLCSNVVVLDAGRVQYCGTTAGLALAGGDPAVSATSVVAGYLAVCGRRDEPVD